MGEKNKIINVKPKKKEEVRNTVGEVERLNEFSATAPGGDIYTL